MTEAVGRQGTLDSSFLEPGRETPLDVTRREGLASTPMEERAGASLTDEAAKVPYRGCPQRNPIRRVALRASKEELREVFGDKMPGTGQSMVYRPGLREVKTFSKNRAKLCGDCKFFNHPEGQKRLFQQKQALEIVHDHQWRLEHLGDKPERLAVCDQRDTMLVGPMSAACEHWKPR